MSFALGHRNCEPYLLRQVVQKPMGPNANIYGKVPHLSMYGSKIEHMGSTLLFGTWSQMSQMSFADTANQLFQLNNWGGQ